MEIIEFNHAHIPEAMALSLANYEEERRHVLALPQVDCMPDLTPYAENNLGVTVFENGKMTGFLCGSSPWDNAWEIKGLRNIFSPMGAHGAIGNERAKIFAVMYQSVAEKWVKAKAVGHAVCLYAHDKKVQEQFYRYGFGLRCMDAIRPMTLIDCMNSGGYAFVELLVEEIPSLYPLDQLLNQHYHKSPFFMNRTPDTLESFTRQSASDGTRHFAAKIDAQICAYITISDSGEAFIASGEDYRHICGAYCLPQHRGKGVMQHLLNYIISTLKAEGYTRLGVDFESFNPNAYGFWLKYFKAYTHSVVRRIDENILEVTYE